MVPVEITITDDAVFEQLETFTVSLVRDPADPINEVIIDPDIATVFIQEEDGKVILFYSISVIFAYFPGCLSLLWLSHTLCLVSYTSGAVVKKRLSGFQTGFFGGGGENDTHGARPLGVCGGAPPGNV